MVQEVKDAIQVLKQIKSLKGDLKDMQNIQIQRIFTL